MVTSKSSSEDSTSFFRKRNIPYLRPYSWKKRSALSMISLKSIVSGQLYNLIIESVEISLKLIRYLLLFPIIRELHCLSITMLQRKLKNLGMHQIYVIKLRKQFTVQFTTNIYCLNTFNEHMIQLFTIYIDYRETIDKSYSLLQNNC